MKKYNILVGKIDKNGNGDLDCVGTFDNLGKAKEAFDKQVNYEKETIKGWNLNKIRNEKVNVCLEVKDSEQNNADNFYHEANYIDVVEIE